MGEIASHYSHEGEPTTVAIEQESAEQEEQQEEDVDVRRELPEIPMLVNECNRRQEMVYYLFESSHHLSL